MLNPNLTKMFNLFNKKPQEPEIPEWVKEFCIFFEIDPIPTCRDWEYAAKIYYIALDKLLNNRRVHNYTQLSGESCLKIYFLVMFYHIRDNWDNNLSVNENMQNGSNEKGEIKQRFLEIIDYVNNG